MQDFDRILIAYGQRQTDMVDDLVAELDASPEERARLRVVAQLVQSIVHTFGTLDSEWSALQSNGFVERRSPSPLPQVVRPEQRMARPEQSDIVHTSLRSLVDADSLTAWQARFINMNLGLKRTVFICGEPMSGRSTFLNALIGLLPVSQRLVLVADEAEGLPVVKDRPGIVQKSAVGWTARVEALREAARTKPDWMLVEELAAEEGSDFLEALQGSCGGLASIAACEPGGESAAEGAGVDAAGPFAALEAPLNTWLATDRKAAQRLAHLRPLVLHVHRQDDDEALVVELLEANVKDGKAVLTPHSGLS